MEKEAVNPAVMARRAYSKEWRQKNKDRVRQYNKRFWERKAQELMQAQAERQGEGKNEG